MNHFMLPEDTTQGKSTWLDEDAGLATPWLVRDGKPGHRLKLAPGVNAWK
jgi:hypothetical protein